MSINNPRGLVGVVIDMQECFLRRITSEERDYTIEEQIKVINKLSEINVPVIIIEFKNSGETDLRIKKAVEKIYFGSYISKEDYSGFSNPELYQTLRIFNSRELILMGINASSCVMSTAEEAMLRGYGLVTNKNIILNEDRLTLESGEEIDGKKRFEIDFNRFYKENSVIFNTTEGLVNYAVSP